MMKLFGQMMKLPLRAVVYSMEMLVKTMQGLQRIADQGIDGMINGIASTGDGVITDPNDLTKDPPMTGDPQPSEDERRSASDLTNQMDVFNNDGAVSDRAGTTYMEQTQMRDTNLNDEMLKLVRYKILFVKRDYEHAFKEYEELVPDNTNEGDYKGWKVAQFVQKIVLSREEDRIPVPDKWRDKYYPSGEYALPKDKKKAEAEKAAAKEAWSAYYKIADDPKVEKEKKVVARQKAEKADEDAKVANQPYWLIGFPEEDKKYLRVFYEVLDRYPREKLKYEERQLEILEKIAENVKPRG